MSTETKKTREDYIQFLEHSAKELFPLGVEASLSLMQAAVNVYFQDGERDPILLTKMLNAEIYKKKHL